MDKSVQKEAFIYPVLIATVSIFPSLLLMRLIEFNHIWSFLYFKFINLG